MPKTKGQTKMMFSSLGHLKKYPGLSSETFQSSMRELDAFFRSLISGVTQLFQNFFMFPFLQYINYSRFLNHTVSLIILK